MNSKKTNMNNIIPGSKVWVDMKVKTAKITKIAKITRIVKNIEDNISEDKNVDVSFEKV